MANSLHDLRDGLTRGAGVAVLSDRLPVASDAPGPAAGGWPVEPADIWVVERGRPVGLCTLGDPDLARLVAAERWEQLALAGPLATENIGVEKLVRNVLAAPWLRVLLLVGPETGGTAPTGHYAADALCSLLERGVDPDSMRIRGARGRRPVVRNLTCAEVDAFRATVTVVDRRGEVRVEVIRAAVAGAAELAGRDGTFATAESGSRAAAAQTPVGAAAERPGGYRPDPAGYVLLFVDRDRGCVVVEHYTNAGVRTGTLEGDDPQRLAQRAIELAMIGRLDHAAYLGRELERATRALRGGVAYVQDGP